MNRELAQDGPADVDDAPDGSDRAEHTEADHTEADGAEVEHTEADGGQAEHTEADGGQAEHTEADGGQAEHTEADGGQGEHTDAEGGRAVHGDHGDRRDPSGGKPTVLLPIAPGTNRNEELAVAFRAAGAEVNQVPLQLLRSGEVKLIDHQLLALPGGFSYGDALGAGKLLALDLSGWFADQLNEAREREMPIIGICNGFQALVRAGLLPGDVEPSEPSGYGLRPTGAAGGVAATLAENANGRFECRWVHLAPGAGHSPWMAELSAPVRCPVAHGEGRFVTTDAAAIGSADLVAFRYCDADGAPAGGAYPANPNGSDADIAGIVDPSGLVLGLMPHPEDHVFARQDPHWRQDRGGRCLAIFSAGVGAVRHG